MYSERGIALFVDEHLQILPPKPILVEMGFGRPHFGISAPSSARSLRASKGI